MDADFEVVAEALAKQGGLLALGRSKSITVSFKNGDVRDVVTDVDKEISRELEQVLAEKYPEHLFYSEEDKRDVLTSLEYIWIIDPIDGTSNYARGISHYSCCVTLMKGGEVIVAALYQPVLDESFVYSKRGAFCNGAPMKVGDVTCLKDAYVNFHSGRKLSDREWAGETLKMLLGNAKKSFNLASSGLDLCQIAQGKVDVVIYGTLSTIDVAGAVALLRKAGGEVYNYTTKQPVEFLEEPQKIIATANPELLQDFFSKVS